MMKIQEKQGDLLSVTSGILVHGCNCQGVMGSGIAKHVRSKWSDVYTAYTSHRAKVGLELGDIVAVGSQKLFGDKQLARHLHAVTPQLPDEVVVVNAMTQFYYGADPGVVYVDYDAVFAAFARIRILARDSKLSVHFPLIGCGLANGDWNIVSKLIEQALGPDVEATLWTLPPAGQAQQQFSLQATLI